jgi:hypothetical protein
MNDKEIFDRLLDITSSQRFLDMQGLGNEVPFFICPFPPENALTMADLGNNLIKQLQNRGIHVLKINLYDLSVELLQERQIWKKVLERESTMSKDELRELLEGVLDPERHVIPAIANKMSEGDFDVMFITGVGEVFPYIRSHTILNNLQSAAKDKPTLMFFPGEYKHSREEGSSLALFSRLHNNNYYRAFNIFNFKV